MQRAVEKAAGDERVFMLVRGSRWQIRPDAAGVRTVAGAAKPNGVIQHPLAD